MQGYGDVMTFGPATRQGKIVFEPDFRCLVMYDTEESFNMPDENLNSVVAIFDKSTLLDYNKIVSFESETDDKALEIQLVQQEELSVKDIERAKKSNN